MSTKLSTGYVQAIHGVLSFAQIFMNGTIEVRSGAQPANADAAATGTLLARITSGGAFTHGSPTNGLQWDLSGRFMQKSSLQEWFLNGIGTGTAGWFRILPNAADSGLLSITEPRIDGAIGVIDTVGDFQLYIPTLSIIPATNTEVNNFWYAVPPLA